MKKKVFAFIFAFVLLINCFSSFSYAEEIKRIDRRGQIVMLNDVVTMGMVTSAIYSISQNAGLGWLMGGMTGSAANQYLTNEVNSYLAGDTLAEKFGSEILRLEAGKLIVPASMYNGIVDFLEAFNQKYDYTDPSNYIYVSYGDISAVAGGTEANASASDVRAIYFYTNEVTGTVTQASGGWWETRRNLTNDGITVVTDPTSPFPIKIRGVYSYDYAGSRSSAQTPIVELSASQSKTIGIDNENYVAPTVIDPSWGWFGQFDGIPDTNLEELMGGIFEDIADNNLIVDGEVGPIDPPQPSPTPMPIDPDTPLQDVPWEGLDNNLDRLYEQGLEEIGTIGEAKDAITDAVADQTGTLEDAISDNAGVVSGAIDQAVSDVQTAIGSQTGAIGESIADNAGVVSGAIDQAVSDVQTAIGEQTAALDESLSATAEGVETIAEAIEDENINWRKFDLRGLFPFCIPFDIYNMLSALDSSPVAPHVQLPFVIPSIGFSYNIDLDFSAFDSVAAIMRQMELICYGIALAWATSKVIKW